MRLPDLRDPTMAVEEVRGFLTDREVNMQPLQTLAIPAAKVVTIKMLHNK